MKKVARKFLAGEKSTEILCFQRISGNAAAKQRRAQAIGVLTGYILELQTRQDDASLRLILAVFIFVAEFAVFIGEEEDDLAKSFVGVNLRRQRRGIADFEGDKTFPLRLKRRDVDDDAAAGIGGLADADRQ